MKNVLRTLLFDGEVSLTIADTTELVREGIRLHGITPEGAKVFGRALSGTAFMSACLKGEKGEISLAVQSDGTGGSLGVSGNAQLSVRGYIEHTQAIGTQREILGKEGSLTVIRQDGYSRPFVGSCAFPVDGDFDKILEEYYRISEQLPTRIFTTVETDGKECSFAGVVALQPLPFASEKSLQACADMDLEGLLLGLKTASVEEVVKGAFAVSEYQIREVKYRCNCSKEYLAGVLVTLGESQLKDIVQTEGAVRVHCHYCNKDYAFTEEDVDELFEKHERKKTQEN